MQVKPIAKATKAPSPRQSVRRASPLPRAARIVAWVLGLPALLSLLVYVVLLMTPIKLPLGSDAVQALISSTIPSSSTLQLGDMALTLESGIWPVVQFSPVLLTDSNSGARVEIGALEVGFSPVRALFGKPGATITLVAPHLQIVQDLSGLALPVSMLLMIQQADRRPCVCLRGQTRFPPPIFRPTESILAGRCRRQQVQGFGRTMTG
ncbi:hypothetical protein PSQ19_04795 [Devosia algicola]|uniref:AsmA domain-containing protein n=1 Tax=Devosia algicola TaxID=3026418 RepID=A0ABY7YQG6_9HYPH|nr:hypothetical protein [Devosia algicola]WDR03432.1 hypothetical protein PSQ19_04795 [Devosia algicola]